MPGDNNNATRVVARLQSRAHVEAVLVKHGAIHRLHRSVIRRMNDGTLKQLAKKTLVIAVCQRQIKELAERKREGDLHG
jgi:hypothetical protein